MATTDILTADEARQALSRGPLDADRAELLTATVTAISLRLDEACGPVVYGGTLGTLTETYSGGGTAIYLKKSPIVSVSQVVEYDGTNASTLSAESNSSQPDNAYRVNTVNGKLLRRNQNSTQRFAAGFENVRVVYVAGRYGTTAACDEKFKAAARVILKNVWRMWENSVALGDGFESPTAHIPSFLTPNVAKSLLGHEWREGGGI